jgi:regulator of cell morphogenesis and NO signaling
MNDRNAAAVLDAERTVNETVLHFPATLGVFRGYGIDSCCGGGLPVGEAARRHGVDPEELLQALRAAVDGAV